MRDREALVRVVRTWGGGVVVGEADPDEAERMTLVRLPLEEAVQTARRGGFAEGQTALTILLAAERLENLSLDPG